MYSHCLVSSDPKIFEPVWCEPVSNTLSDLLKIILFEKKLNIIIMKIILEIGRIFIS